MTGIRAVASLRNGPATSVVSRATGGSGIPRPPGHPPGPDRDPGHRRTNVPNQDRETPRRHHGRRAHGSTAHRGSAGRPRRRSGGQDTGRHRRRSDGPAGDGPQGGLVADRRAPAGAADRPARRLRRQGGAPVGRPELRAVRAHVPRPARHRRRLRRRHRRPGPRAGHLGRADQQDPPLEPDPEGRRGPGPHRRPPPGEAGLDHRGPAPGRLAGQDLPPGLGDQGRRPRPRPRLAEVRVRRRPHRQAAREQGARRRGHRATATGRARSPSRPAAPARRSR